MVFTTAMDSHDRPRFDGFTDPTSGIGTVFRERPTKYMMLLAHAQEILREPSHLSAADREVIAAYTSKLNGCHYCRGSHTAFAESLGASEADLEMVTSGATDGHRLAALLAYVKKLTQAPASISNNDKLAVHAAGFSEDELKDAIAVCAAFNLYNRIVEGHGIAPHDDYTADVAMINTHGFDRRY